MDIITKNMKKKIIVIMMFTIMIFTMIPNKAEATSKKHVTVSVNTTKLIAKKSAQLKVKYGRKNVTKKAKYKTSNKRVATVGKYGCITTRKSGKFIITVKYKNDVKKIKFTVVNPPKNKTVITGKKLTSRIIKKNNKDAYIQIGNTKMVVNTGMQLTGSDAIIACGNYYNSVLEAAVEKGEKWVYSNSSRVVSQNGSFDKMLEGKIRGGNCASIANWAFRDMGITSSGEVFYGDSNGNIRNYNSGSKKLKSKLDKCCNIISGGNKSFATLMKEGKIKVGDIIIGKSHTYIYRGNGTVFASGHDAKWHKDKSVKTDDPNKAVFETWVRKYKGTYDERYKVHYIIRVKDGFVPKYYRNKDGNLVKNKQERK